MLNTSGILNAITVTNVLHRISSDPSSLQQNYSEVKKLSRCRTKIKLRISMVRPVENPGSFTASNFSIATLTVRFCSH